MNSENNIIYNSMESTRNASVLESSTSISSRRSALDTEKNREKNREKNGENLVIEEKKREEKKRDRNRDKEKELELCIPTSDVKYDRIVTHSKRERDDSIRNCGNNDDHSRIGEGLVNAVDLTLSDSDNDEKDVDNDDDVNENKNNGTNSDNKNNDTIGAGTGMRTDGIHNDKLRKSHNNQINTVNNSISIDDWTCTACTYVNYSRELFCEVCLQAFSKNERNFKGRRNTSTMLIIILIIR